MKLTICDKLHELIEEADIPEIRARLQAVYDDLCGGMRTNDESGGNGPPPKQPKPPLPDQP